MFRTILIMCLHWYIGFHLHCAGGGQQSAALPLRLAHEMQLEINISMTLQADSSDLTLFRQFWQCICTSIPGYHVIVLKEGNNLRHCLTNWCVKLSFEFHISMALQTDCRDLTLFGQFRQYICTSASGSWVTVFKEENNLRKGRTDCGMKFDFQREWVMCCNQISITHHTLPISSFRQWHLVRCPHPHPLIIWWDPSSPLRRI